MQHNRHRILQRSVRLDEDAETSSNVDGKPVASQFSRRRFLAGAGASAAVGAAMLTPDAALATDHQFELLRGKRCRPGAPRPIPGEDPDLAGLGLHLFLPEAGKEPSTIFDFHGRVAG